MKLPMYQVDAFADRPFEGNPAAVCPLDTWLPDELMQSIAMENNLSETAFFVREADRFRIRWFTPTAEVDLCGHATLASAHVLFEILGFEGEELRFDSHSGPLTVSRSDDWLVLDFPAQPPEACETPPEIVEAFGAEPVECLRHVDYIAVYDGLVDIKTISPRTELLASLDLRAVIITAESRDHDFVARVFAPRFGIPEDPVTGSAYTQLAPYWAQQLDKRRFRVRQESARGGELRCELAGDRVLIAGKAASYMEGILEVGA